MKDTDQRGIFYGDKKHLPNSISATGKAAINRADILPAWIISPQR
jgi:hypothetical protein